MTELIKNSSLKWLILCVMASLIFLGNFDFTAVVLATPIIAKNLHASLSDTQWFITAYIISSAAFIIINGQVCNKIGKKKTFLVGCAIFAITSLVCAISSNVMTIIIARFTQGIGYALAFPLIYDFVFTLFPERNRGISISILHFTTAIAQAIGPTLGGVLAHTLSWRWIFLFNVPICLFVIIFSAKILPNDNEVKTSNRSEILSAFFVLAALISLMFALNQDMFSINFDIIKNTFLGFLISTVCFITFFRIENSNISPLIHKSLKSDKDFIRINVARIIIQFIFIEFLFFPNLYLQNVLGYSMATTGVAYLAMTLVFAALSLISGKLIDRINPKIPLVIGLISLILSSIFLYVAGLLNSFNTILFSFSLTGIGIGLTFPSSLYICMHSSIGNENKKLASSIFLMNALIGCSLGAALTGFILSISAKVNLYYFIFSNKLTLNLEQRHLLETITTGIKSLKDVNLNFLNVEQLQQVLKIFFSSLSVIIVINVLLLLLAVKLSLQLTTEWRSSLD